MAGVGMQSAEAALDPAGGHNFRARNALKAEGVVNAPGHAALKGVSSADEQRVLQEDAAAAKAVLSGDVDAFRHFVDRYGQAVERALSRHVRPQEIPGLAQDTFVQAFGSLKSYDTARPFSRWITTIALRTAYGYLRKRYKSREMSFSSLGEDCREWLEAGNTPGAVEKHRDREVCREAEELLEWALERISPKDRMVLTLTYIHGHSMAEAAGMLSMTTVNARVRAHRAKKKMRELLEALMEETS